MDTRLPLKIQENINDLGSLARHIAKSSKSSEHILQSARIFAAQEQTILNSEKNLEKIQIQVSHLEFQEEAIERSFEVFDTLQDQLQTLQR
ncbi:BLOC-1-related complex subunit 7-like [Antedon mediterranea]|uniref:BLOC-1-related complex subunit 7-like n=1 Tax=Antedon mediterranea TaxID=105859 RepID=UPI003AF965AA